jgi:hypothetical protein
MHSNAIIVQAAITIPIMLGLVVYTLIRWERTALHSLLAVLLTSVAVWLGGTSLKLGGGEEWVRLVGLHIEAVTVLFLAPLFLVTMGYFARSALFEQSLAPSIGLFAVSGVWADRSSGPRRSGRRWRTSLASPTAARYSFADRRRPSVAAPR